jgi:hypothetical protein
VAADLVALEELERQGVTRDRGERCALADRAARDLTRRPELLERDLARAREPIELLAPVGIGEEPRAVRVDDRRERRTRSCASGLLEAGDAVLEIASHACSPRPGRGAPR